jgi:pimeloyl-ACP methyl ester carboxylesterase
MTTGARATSEEESRVLIPCGDAVLSAYITEPTVEPNGIMIVWLAGRWSVTSIGRSRVFVNLAREFAAKGYHSIRIDFLGLGESTGEEWEWHLDRLSLVEPAAIVTWLAENGYPDIVLAGTCGGARMALSAAPDFDNLLGLVLLAPPLREFKHGTNKASLPTKEFVKRALDWDIIRGLTDAKRRRRYVHQLQQRLRLFKEGRAKSRSGEAQPKERFQWVSRAVTEPLEALVDRGVPVLFFFGELDGYYDDLKRGSNGGRLKWILDNAGDLVTIDTVPGRFFGLGEVEMRDETLKSIDPWLEPIERAHAARRTQTA